MGIADEHPALTRLLDEFFHDGQHGDERAVAAFLARYGDHAREAVLEDLRALIAMQHDPFELRFYLATHRHELIPDEGAVSWFERLGELLARAWG